MRPFMSFGAVTGTCLTAIVGKAQSRAADVHPDKAEPCACFLNKQFKSEDKKKHRFRCFGAVTGT